MPPLLIAAGIGAVGAIGGAVISSHGASKAADAASQASQANNAVQRQIYQQNTANETPFMDRGNAAGGQINDLLGLGGHAAVPATPTYGGYGGGGGGGYGGNGGYGGGGRNNGYGDGHGNIQGYNDPGQVGAVGTPAVSAQSAQDAAGNAFNQFTNSDGYQFRLGQGTNAVNTNMALRGSLGSGAAAKELLQYGQGEASNEFGKYVGMLQNQQGVGLSAANALAGIGTDYAKGISSNNNNAASAAGNAAMSSSNAFGNAFSSIGGNIANAVQQSNNSSYGGGGGGAAFARQYGTGGTAYGSGGY
jgi:hypothetical protein